VQEIEKEFKEAKSKEEMQELLQEGYEVHSMSEWINTPESFSCLMVRPVKEKTK